MAKKGTSKPVDIREACVREAYRIVAKEGYEELSLRQVAKNLGISHQAPYKHFPSRDALLAEVSRRAFRKFAKHLDQRKRATDPVRDLVNMGLAYIQFALSHEFEYELMFDCNEIDEKDFPELETESQHAFSVLRDSVAKLQATRCVPSLPLDAEALLIWATVHGLVSILGRKPMESIAIDNRQIEKMLIWNLRPTLGAFGREG